MGGTKSENCINIACRIWNFYIEIQLWVTAAHILVKNNIGADQESKLLQDATECKFHTELFHKIVEIFHKIVDKFGKPYTDLFASRINRQVKRYMSWHPEQEALSLTWNNNNYFTCSHLLVL